MEKKGGKKEKGGSGKQKSKKNKPQRNISEILTKQTSINKRDVELLLRENENFDHTIDELEHKFEKLKGKTRFDVSLNNRFATEKLITQGLSPIFHTNAERAKKLTSISFNFSDNSLNTHQGFVELFESLSNYKYYLERKKKF